MGASRIHLGDKVFVGLFREGELGDESVEGTRGGHRSEVRAC